MRDITAELEVALTEGDAGAIVELVQAAKLAAVVERAERIGELRAELADMDDEYPALIEASRVGRERAIAARDAEEAARKAQTLVARESGMAQIAVQGHRERRRQVQAELDELLAQVRADASSAVRQATR